VARRAVNDADPLERTPRCRLGLLSDASTESLRAFLIDHVVLELAVTHTALPASAAKGKRDEQQHQNPANDQSGRHMELPMGRHREHDEWRGST